MKRFLIGTAIVVGVIAAALFVLQPALSSNAAAGAGNQETAIIQRINLDTLVSGTGVVEAEKVVNLTFGIGGNLEEIQVDVGDTVQSGDLLAQLDTANLLLQVDSAREALAIEQANYESLTSDPTQAQITQAEASLASAMARLADIEAGLNIASNQITTSCADLDTAQTAYDNAQDAWEDYVLAGYEMDATFLPDDESAAGNALDDAQSRLDKALATCDTAETNAQDLGDRASAQATVAQAQAVLDELLSGPTDEQITRQSALVMQRQIALQQAENNLADASLYAPFSGIVTDVRVTEGEQVGANTVAIIIADDSQLHFMIDVDEQDVFALNEGQPARITLSALGDTLVEGVVERIAPSASLNQGITTYPVRINVLEGQSVPVRIGMTADIEIVTGREENVLAVDSRAILRDGNEEYVLVSTSLGSQRVAVQTGDLANGLTVIYADTLKDGQTVLIEDQTTSTTRIGAGLLRGGN
ncbi:MAG: efflux RND transporter periplasmic adaptor subunit [Anaerolineaceae bacterium]|nr:efflux RND transporter periplasmic adaptor subunit [Anaerolineaceae bacterium]